MTHETHDEWDMQAASRRALEAAYPPGSLLAGYRLIKLIGAGGLGAVFEAIHGFTNRRVALKLLLPQYAGSDEARERARREAIALCQLRHKNIVSVHSADVLPDGTVWIAMELLEGQLLRRICAVEAPLPVERALYIGIEIADGLAAAHDLDIIHRDVKPENVFVSRQSEVKILDLNIAKVRVDGLLSTLPGRRFGTTAYLSPEACWDAPCEPASDVYALMLIVYEMLTGRYPFATGKGLQGMPSEAALIHAHVTLFPRPPHEILSSIPDYFWPTLQRGLAKLKEQRFPNGAVAASALRELRDRYLTDLRRGRLGPSTVTEPGARREHQGPRAPERLITMPVFPEPRVILPAGARATELGASGAPDARMSAARAEDGTAGPTPTPTSLSAQPFVTPAPVTVAFSREAARRGPWLRLPTTARVLDRQRRALLLRRCVMAAVLGISISGLSTALYMHLSREHPTAAVLKSTSAALESVKTPAESAAAGASTPAGAESAAGAATPAGAAKPEAAPDPSVPALVTVAAPALGVPTRERTGNVPARASAAVPGGGAGVGAPASGRAARAPASVLALGAAAAGGGAVYPVPPPSPVISQPAAQPPPRPTHTAPPRPF